MKAILMCSTLFLALALVLPGSGIAGPALYFGAGFGLTESSDLSMFGDFKDAADRDPDASIVFSAEARTDAGPKILAGYRFHEHVALEAAWVDLGSRDTEFTVRQGSAPDISYIGGKLLSDVNGFSLSGVGLWPAGGRVELFGKLGAFLWWGDYAVDLDNVPSESEPSGEENGISLLAGAGVSFTFANHWAIRGEFEFYEGIDYKVNFTTLEGDANVWALTLAIIYSL